jgi:bifunctional DNA-binding transcriptional regulator/antitoxin component of YhaV-PrlF toxin-antitoxin module
VKFDLSVLSLDDKNRVVVDKKTREVSGLKKGSKLVAIPFKGGVTLVDVTEENFVGRMTGFGFVEDAHEASKYLFEKRSKKLRRKSKKRK